MLNVKSGENWTGCFREDDIKKLQDFIHVYSPGAGQITPRDKILIVTERVCYFDHAL